jgi:hypothetical protein
VHGEFGRAALHLQLRADRYAREGVLQEEVASLVEAKVLKVDSCWR